MSAAAGPVAWVTGAARGIGRAAVDGLAASGWTVWASDLDRAALDALADRHTSVRGAAVDVTDVSAVGQVVDRIEAADGRLDALVASAAVFPRRSLGETTVDGLHTVLAVNVVGVAAAVLAGRRLMAGSGGGAMVLMTSGAAARSGARTALQRGFADYGASKAALERWALGICDELADDRIAMHLLCPGSVVATPGVAAVLGTAEMAEAATPDAVAPAIVRLCGRRDVASTGGRYLAVELDRTWR